jgi:Lrp/AsnC family transcriptional regulator for asnA, asnC and gidA
MGAIIEIDEIDKKILTILIEDARTRLKDIAKYCGISSVSVLNRIKRLKTLGVITGATLFPRLDLLGFNIVATIGIEADANEDQIIKFIGEHTDLIEPAACIGEYDLTALVFTKDIYQLDKVVVELRKITGVRKVTVNVWSGPPDIPCENIDLQPKAR